MVNAIKFPDMLNSIGQTNVIKEKQATSQNLKLLLLSTKQTLIGDPYYGTNLRNMIYEKNNIILRDLVIDDILTNVNLYMPQIRLNRENIEVNSDGQTVHVIITAQNIIDYSFETYSIKLLSVEEL